MDELSFAKGSRLRATVKGEAECAVVRLLGEGESPDSRVGIVDETTVRDDSTVEVELRRDYRHVVQISVHGMNPWGTFCDEGNGGLSLLTVELLPPKE